MPVLTLKGNPRSNNFLFRPLSSDNKRNDLGGNQRRMRRKKTRKAPSFALSLASLNAPPVRSFLPQVSLRRR